MTDILACSVLPKKAAAPIVVADEGIFRTELSIEVLPDGIVPVVLDVTEPVGRLDDERAASAGRIRDAGSVLGRAETNLLSKVRFLGLLRRSRIADLAPSSSERLVVDTGVLQQLQSELVQLFCLPEAISLSQQTQELRPRTHVGRAQMNKVSRKRN